LGGFGGYSCGASSTVLKPNVVGQKVLNFANAQGANATLIEVNNDGEFYEVVLSITGLCYEGWGEFDSKINFFRKPGTDISGISS